VIRNEVFASLDALNRRIRELLEVLNARTMRAYRKSRRELFETIERASLTPLPSARFEYSEWKRARVNLDYHVAFDEHLYSVPYSLVHEEVWIRATHDTVEVLHRGTRVASHRRVRGGRVRFTTVTEHMPSAHRAHAEWTPSRILEWAGKMGAATRALCEAILRERPHPRHPAAGQALRRRAPRGRVCARQSSERALLQARRVDPPQGSRSCGHRRVPEHRAHRARERARPWRIPALRKGT
jgi:hypothetical protein